MSARLYINQVLESGMTVKLSKDQWHHLGRVRRLSLGDDCVLFNGDGREIEASIVEVSASSASLLLGEAKAVSRELAIEMTIAQFILRPSAGLDAREAC